MQSDKRILLGLTLLALAVPETVFAQSATGYVAVGTRCEDVFTRSKSGMVFKRNVDAFAPAFIVSGKTLRTPVATCRLQKSTAKGDLRELQFECASPISYVPVKVYFRKGENDSLIRQASETEAIGNRYERCGR